MKQNIYKIIPVIVFIGLMACQKDTYYPVDKLNCQLATHNHSGHLAYQAVLDHYTQNGVIGVATVIAKPGEDTWIGASGYANIEDNLLLTPCHLQQTASLAKSFTGIVTLQLIEEGKLTFETKIKGLLDEEIHQYIPNIDELTIKHLLQQTSGVPDIFEISFFEKLMNEPEQTYTTNELLSNLKNRKALQAPGEKHVYSDPNFMLLSLIIDKLEGSHIKAFEERIFKPLSLDMYYHNDGFPSPEGLVASYWDQYNNGQYENISELEIRVNAYILGSGGIIASPADMVKFYRAVFNGQLIGSDMLETIKSDWVSEDAENRMNTAYSHGFMVISAEDGDWIGHTGLFPGSSCYVYHHIQKNITIGVFTNTGTFSFLEKMKLIYADLWDDLREEVSK